MLTQNSENAPKWWKKAASKKNIDTYMIHTLIIIYIYIIYIYIYMLTIYNYHVLNSIRSTGSRNSDFLDTPCSARRSHHWIVHQFKLYKLVLKYGYPKSSKFEQICILYIYIYFRLFQYWSHGDLRGSPNTVFHLAVGGFGRSFGRFGMVILNPAWIVMIQIPIQRNSNGKSHNLRNAIEIL